MKVDRAGLGYVGADVASGVQLAIDRLSDAREGLTGELRVSRAPDGQLTWGRFNVLSLPTRKQWARALSDDPRGRSVPWQQFLDEFCDAVIAYEREGAPVVMVGSRPMRPEPPYVLRPLLFKGMSTILFGAGGTGKSSLAAAVAVSLETGRPAFPGWEVREHMHVLVLDWEATEDDWNDMVASVACGMGMKPPDIAYLRMSLPLDGQVHQIAAHVARHGVGAIIADSVTWALRAQRDGGGIDDPVKRMFDALRQIGTTNLLIDHVSKAVATATEDQGGMPIGAIVKVNKARATYELRKAAEPDPDGTQHLALINRKTNPSKPEPTVGIQVRRPRVGALELVEEEAAIGDPVVAHTVSLADRIRGALGRGDRMTAAQIVGAIQLGGKDPEGTVRKTMERKPDLFAKEGSKSPQLWYLIDTEHVPEQVPQVFRNTGTDPYGDLSPRVSSRSGLHGTPRRSASEDRWGGLIDLAERRSLSVDEDVASEPDPALDPFGDPETANDDG